MLGPAEAAQLCAVKVKQVQEYSVSGLCQSSGLLKKHTRTQGFGN